MKRLVFVAVLVAALMRVDVAMGDDVVVPLMDKAPVIDGKVDPAEWSQAVRIDGLVSGDKLQRRYVRTYVGATATHIYVAMQSRLPDEGPLLAAVDHDGLKVVYDDALEIFIDPTPDQEDRVAYQMLANSIGHVGYQAQLHGKATEEATWHGDWQQAHSQADGYWNFECAIPIASMKQAGAGRKTTDGVWQINLCRDWKPDWGWSSFSGQYLWSGINFRFTQQASPIVRQIITGDPAYAAGGASFDLEVKNPSAGPMSITALLDLTRNNMPEVNEVETFTLAAGQEKTITIKLDANDPTTVADLAASVRSGDGKQIYFDRKLHWTKATEPYRWATQKPKDATLVGVQFAYYPTRNRMRVAADISGLPAESHPSRVAAVVRDRLSGVEVKAVELPLDQFKNGKQEVAFDLPPLNGFYELAVQASGDKMKTVQAVKTFERKVFPWESSPVGRSQTVYPPFTPIVVKDKEISTVLRKHQMNDLGLIDQIAATSANTNISKEILAAPMRYRVKIGGKEIACASEPMQAMDVRGDQATFGGKFSAGTLSAQWNDLWDYDGTLRVALTLEPTGGQAIDELTLEIPLRGDVATMIHSNSDRIRSPIAMVIPQTQGKVWDASKLACDEYIKNFCPYIYIGDAVRGLCWFADNDRNWGWDPATPSLDVTREGDQVIVRVHLINKPTVISAERTLVYGMLAAPVKPRLNSGDNPNWWRYRYRRDRYRVLGTDINWFGNHSCGTVYPAGKDMYLWEMLARANREKIPDDQINAFAEYGVKYFQDYGEEMVKTWKFHVQRNLRAHLNGKMVFYYNRASCQELEEFETFKDEWCLDDMRATGKGKSRGEIKVVPSESFIDYNLYWNARSFEVGNAKGINWDNWFIAPSFNTEMTDAYKAADGHIVPAAGIWAMRDQAKRTFVMMNERGMLPIIAPHMTTFCALPMLSFATVQYDWEWKYSEGDVQDRFARPYMQLVTMGELAGTWRAPLHDQLKLANDPWTQRTFAAVRLVHELDGDGGYGTTDKLLVPVAAILDKPGTIAYRYWDDRSMPANCTNADVPLLVYSVPGKEALIIAVSYASADVTAQLDVDWKGLGLEPTATITDTETSAPVGVQDGKIVFPLKKHDLKLIHIGG